MTAALAGGSVAQPIELRRATPADLDTVQDVLSEAARWIRDELGIVDQWPERVPDRIVEAAIDAGELFLVHVGDELAGTVRVQGADEAAWGRDDGDAVYVHSLAVRRRFGGRGLGAAVLDHVQRTADAAGRPALRLDCVAGNDGLKRYYRALGFVDRGEVEQRVGNAVWRSSLFERRTGGRAQ